MTVEKAVELFNRSAYGKHQKIGKYAPFEGGFLLIPKEKIGEEIGIVYYLVDRAGKVTPIHPLDPRIRDIQRRGNAQPI